MKILATAKETGSAAALIGPVKEMLHRKHEVVVYATGSTAEASPFSAAPYRHILTASPGEYRRMVREYDCIVTGMSGFQSPDGQFVVAARAEGIPVLSLLGDQNDNYAGRLGRNEEELPDLIAVMDDSCISRMKEQLPADVAAVIAPRMKPVGWTAFDNYAQLRASYTPAKDAAFRDDLAAKGISLTQAVTVYFSQHLVSQTDEGCHAYDARVTASLFQAAADCGVRLVVKPHPRENTAFLEEAAQPYGFRIIPAKACDTLELILASTAVVAGRSTCLAQSCLLDRNTGGILPEERGKVWTPASPAVASKAILIAQYYGQVASVLGAVTSTAPSIIQQLREQRKRFSVDGRASARFVDLVENFS